MLVGSCAVALRNVEDRLSALAISHEQLQTEVTTIKSKVDKVDNSVSSMKKGQDQLKKDYSQLKQSNNDLKASHDELKKKQEKSITDEELNARLQRMNNIIVHSMPESESDDTEERKKNDVQKVKQLCSQVLNVPDVPIIDAIRLGKRSSDDEDNDKPRPLQVVFSSQQNKTKVLKASGALKSHNGEFEGVQVREDRTPFQRDLMRYLVKELKEKQKASDKEKEDVVWKIKGYRLVDTRPKRKNEDDD